MADITTYEEAMSQIDDAAHDMLADNPDATEDMVYYEAIQVVVQYCTPAVKKEVLRVQLGI